MEMCEHCRMAVVPAADGKCPVCGRVMEGATLTVALTLPLTLTEREKAELAAIRAMEAGQGDDPEKPLRAAVVFAKITGGIFGFFGAISLFAFITQSQLRSRWPLLHVELLGGVVAWFTGIANVLLAKRVQQYRTWAVTMLVTTGSVQIFLTCAVAWLVGSRDAPCGVALGFPLIALLVPMIVNLSRCHGIMRIHNGLLARGFEPVMRGAEPVAGPSDRKA
jgi:hypothetical protein